MQKLHAAAVWFIVTLFVVYAFCLNTASAVFADAIRSTLHASDAGVSLATGAFILAFACMQIPAGYLLDKFNARYIVSFSILLLALGNILISYSDNLLLFTLANFIQGLGAAFAFIAAAVLISQWYAASLFPLLFGLTQTLSCIITGIVHYWFTVELTTHRWNDLYRGLAIYGFSLFILSILFVKTPDNFRRTEPVSWKNSLSMVFKKRQILLCSIAAASSFGVLLAYASLWYIQVANYYAVAHLDAVLISGFIFFGIGIGTPFWGWISNAVQSRKVVVHVTLVTGTMALLLGIYFPHFNINTYLLTQCMSFLIGFLLSGSMLFYTMVSEIATDSTRGVAISVLNTAVFLWNTFLLFLPYLFITAMSKQFFTYLWVLPFCLLVAILLVYFINDTYCNSLGDSDHE